MERVKRLSLTLITVSLFSISSLVASASAQGGPDMAPPAGEKDPCMNLPLGEEQDECYINLDEDLGPKDLHCEDLHTGAPSAGPTEADIARYEKEYRATLAKGGVGRLNDATYAELESKGLSRAEIDCYVEEMAEAARHDAEVDEEPPPEALAEIGEIPRQTEKQVNFKYSYLPNRTWGHYKSKQKHYCERRSPVSGRKSQSGYCKNYRARHAAKARSRMEQRSSYKRKEPLKTKPVPR